MRCIAVSSVSMLDMVWWYSVYTGARRRIERIGEDLGFS